MLLSSNVVIFEALCVSNAARGKLNSNWAGRFESRVSGRTAALPELRLVNAPPDARLSLLRRHPAQYLYLSVSATQTDIHRTHCFCIATNMGCCMSEPDFDEDAWDNHRGLKSPLRNDDTVSTVSGDTAAKNEVHMCGVLRACLDSPATNALLSSLCCAVSVPKLDGG
jgi:hypothetical protein